MRSAVHSIESEILKPHIQYILYNQNHIGTSSLTSFPNTNICIGIINGGRLQKSDNHFLPQNHEGLFAYSTGLQHQPHRFSVGENWDEICIDFNPISYNHFFATPSKPEVFDSGFAQELFSEEDFNTLEKIFACKDIRHRSKQIEDLLIKKFDPVEDTFLQEVIQLIHREIDTISVKKIMEGTKCSERKLYRVFNQSFGIRPKMYIRILRIRKAIEMSLIESKSLTEIAYACGYADQSHLVKESKKLCHCLPKRLRKHLSVIDNQVVVEKSKG